MNDIKIPYVEIRDINTRKILGVIEGAEIFFEYAYSGVGAFEIYCRSTPNARKLLVADNLVTLPSSADETEDNVWIIDKIEKMNDQTGGLFIVATGTEAKSIVNRRIIRYETLLSGNSNIAAAVKLFLFNPNIISPKDSNRKINGFVFGDYSKVTKTVGETTRVTWDNLFDYTEELYQKVGCAAKLRLDKDTKQFIYSIYEGEDKRKKIAFSQANENLLSSEYVADFTNYKTSAIVGGEEIKDADGNDSGVRYWEEVPNTATGISRREVFIDARDLQSEYEDENGEKQTMTISDYKTALIERGREKLSSEHRAEKVFTADIDTTSNRYKFGRDYYLGDIVTNRDEDEKIYKPVRVVKFTRVQNSEGYKEYFESEEVEDVE